MVIDLDELTGLEDSSIFRLSPASLLPAAKEEDLLFGIRIGINYNQNIVQRSGYTVLDVLSDVGGLQGILISAFILLTSILNHNNLESYMVSKLFKFDSVALSTSQTENIKEYCTGLLPRKLVCCPKNRRQIAMKNARASLEKQMELMKMIQSKRFVHLALKHLLDPVLRRELKA